MDDLKDKIENYLKDNTMSALAESAGVEISSISRFISGQQKGFNYSTAIKILNVIEKKQAAA